MVDAAFGHFELILEEFSVHQMEAETEQDIRFSLINRVLIEVLGWEFHEVKTERKNAAGYSDYLLTHASKTRAILEAKRQSESLVDTKSQKITHLKLGGPGLKSAKDGIEQAQNYCINEGVDFAILCNGITWIAYLATRTDGKRPSEGKAIVFPNLTTIKENFAKFYDLFSKDGVTSKLYRSHISEAEGFSLSPSEPLFHAIDESSIRIGQKTNLARDLEEVFDSFFSTISGDDNKRLLLDCFVDSKESEFAEKDLAKIASELIHSLEPMNESTGGQLASEIERAVEVSRGEKVLIIGNKGSGKSTFIERFFEVSLDRDVRKKCQFIRIDLAKYSGDNEKSLGDWLDRRLQDEIDRSLYGNGVPEYDDLQGVFFSDYQKWSQGQHKHLYRSNREAFKIEFGKHLNSVIEDQPHRYCVAQLKNAVSSRKLLPCIVFDNTDQFSVEIQQKVFQYANAVFEETHSAFLIIPITDRTVWQLSKDGPLQSYKSKSFFLPVPSTKKILEKRIQYVGREIETQEDDGGEYALPNGFRIKIENLKAFAACLENVFIENEFIARRIGFLSNFDIRRSLELSRRLMTSHHVGVENLVAAFLAKNELEIPRWRITTGLVSGPHDNFRQDQSSFILNLFEVDANEINSPLLKLRLLSLLLDKENSVNNALDSYLTIGEIEGYFEPMGVPAQVTRSNLQKLISYRLIEPYDPTEEAIRPGQKVSITTSGKMHRELALYDTVFFSQMALVTGIRSADLSAELRTLAKPGGNYLNKMTNLRSQFLEYCIEQDARFLKIPQDSDNYAGQVALGDELQNRRPLQKVKGRVNWFNRKEGYGFVHLEELKKDAYLSLTVAEEFGRNSFESGDKMVCDAVQTPRGFQIVSIVEAAETPSPKDVLHLPNQQSNLQMGTVVFYNAEKGFGFIKPNDGGKDILLPRRILNSAGFASIDEGQNLLVETEMKIKGPVASSILLD